MAPGDFKTKEALIEALFNRYKSTMTAIAVSFMGNSHDADDVVQLAMMKIVNNIDKIDDIDSVRCKHFIMVITKNTALNEIKKIKNRKTVTIAPDKMVNIVEPGFEMHKFENKYGFSDEIIKLLHELKEIDRDILCLKYGDDYANIEIAEILGITETAVRQRLSRARKRLCEIIEGGGETHHERNGKKG